MTESDILGIESALGLALPRDYRQFLVAGVDEAKRIAEDLPFLATSWTDADEIIRGNRLARAFADEMTIGEDEDDETSWPDRYVLVGTNGGGDFWFVQADGGEPGLWFWEHESHEIRHCHTTFDEYVDSLRNDVADPDRRRAYGG